MTDTCSNCRFGHLIPWSSETSGGKDLFCRIDPPEFVPPSGSTLKPVRQDGWCGRHETAHVHALKITTKRIRKVAAK
jgi:hypothetical protein